MLFVKPPNLILCYGALSRLVQFVCWLFCCCCLFALVVAIWLVTLWQSTSLSSIGRDFHLVIHLPPNSQFDSRWNQWLKHKNSYIHSLPTMWLQNWHVTKVRLNKIKSGMRVQRLTEVIPDGWDLEGFSISTEWKSSLLQHERKVCLWVKPISAWALDQAISRAWYLLRDGVLIVQGNCKMPN